MTRKTDKQIDQIAHQCAAVRLRILNRVVSKMYDDALRPLQLKVSQMNILVATSKLGTARPAVVCEHLHMDASTLSRNVERMRARGWLQVVDDDDGRAQPFELTAQGRSILRRAVPAWNKAQQRVKQLLGADIVERLDSVVAQLKLDANVG